MVMGGIVSVQLGSALATSIFDELSPTATVFLRVALAAPILLLIWRPSRRDHDRRALGIAALYGLILACMNLSFYLSIDRIPLGIAVTLEFTGPLAVAILGSRRPVDLLWVAMAAAGIVLLSPGISGSVDTTGAALALLAGAFWGLYILVSVKVGEAFETGAGLAIALSIGAVLLLPAGVIEGGSELLKPELLGVAFAVAILSSAIPYSLELEALRSIASATFGVLMSIEPAVASLIGLIALNQGLGAGEVVAIALVVAASAGALGTGPPLGERQPGPIPPG